MMFRSAPFSARSAADEASPRAPKPDATSVKGAVEHSVEMAYRVIDELLQRGRRAADRASPQRKAEPLRTNQMNLASMMMQTWMDMGRMWFGFMMPLLQPGTTPWGPRGSGFGGAFGPDSEGQQHSATNVEGRTKVTLDLRSDRPTEVMIDLNHASAGKKKLSVQSLRSGDSDAGKPAISGIDFAHHQDGSIRLSINVPVGQPHGTYSGAILTHDGSPVGAVSLKIHEIHGSPRHEPAA